jgi:hypothetical protein
MATALRIRVMISSRCLDPIQFAGKSVLLSVIRRKLKQDLESEKLLDSAVFDVWISEDAPPADGGADSWEHCMEQVHAADLILVLYNGNSGWAREGGELGICHGELEAALSRAPEKVYLLQLPMAPLRNGEDGARDERFRLYVERHNLFRGQAVNTGEEVLARSRQTLREAVAKMVKLGGRESKKGRAYVGDALIWSRLSFADRRSAMESVLKSALLARTGSEDHDRYVFVRIGDQPVLVVCHGIPESLGVSAAREMIGQPFLQDHRLANIAKDASGPVHLIGCRESVTKSQARRILGFPDAMIVDTPFGIYVASEIEKIQLIFIRGCSDESSTRLGVQRLFEWLEQSEEAPRLKNRAVSRERIVRVLAEVNQEKVVSLEGRKPLKTTFNKHRKPKSAAG